MRIACEQRKTLNFHEESHANKFFRCRNNFYTRKSWERKIVFKFFMSRNFLELQMQPSERKKEQIFLMRKSFIRALFMQNKQVSLVGIRVEKVDIISRYKKRTYWISCNFSLSFIHLKFCHCWQRCSNFHSTLPLYTNKLWYKSDFHLFCLVKGGTGF